MRHEMRREGGPFPEKLYLSQSPSLPKETTLMWNIRLSTWTAAGQPSTTAATIEFKAQSATLPKFDLTGQGYS
jgi:hypothetical protein